MVKSQSPWAKSTESHLYTRLGWLAVIDGNMKEAHENFKQSLALRGGFPVPKDEQ
jgi:hypothetical protein